MLGLYLFLFAAIIQTVLLLKSIMFDCVIFDDIQILGLYLFVCNYSWKVFSIDLFIFYTLIF